MRGENPAAHAQSSTSRGTSPRARGKPHQDCWFGPQVRNIPACAGKTCSGQMNHRAAREHPRVRGENHVPILRFHHRKGTSPRARGKLGTALAEAVSVGNIPACAGKTQICGPGSGYPGEHPRVRGENTYTLFTLHQGLGTSPRARGKPRPGQGSAGHRRNIPACAGKTRASG